MIHKLKVQKTNRVIVLGEPEKAKIVLIALHGYGQLVTFFQRRFHELDLNRYCIILPEGMHRFYLSGTEGRVGASWMTKEERIDDIADNLDYLDRIYQTYIKQDRSQKVVVLGFSQGAATAARWIQFTENKIDCFIQWAGVFPPDLDLSKGNSVFSDIEHFYVAGDTDPYFQNVDLLETQKAWMRENGVHPEFVEFHGGHTIDSACLNRILIKLL